MVKLTGPALSLGAHGTVAGTLSFAKVRGHAYVKRKPTVPNMKTRPQIAIRQMIRFLTTEWTGLTESEKDSYAEAALDFSIARYHAYLKLNMQRWRIFHRPTKPWPPPDGGLYPNITPTSADGYYRMAIVGWTTNIIRDGWGNCLFRSQSNGFTPTRNDTVHVEPLVDATAQTWTDTPLAPGTYYYRQAAFNWTGRTNVFTPQKTAVVT